MQAAHQEKMTAILLQEKEKVETECANLRQTLHARTEEVGGTHDPR
jgi:hypothetical protein